MGFNQGRSIFLSPFGLHANPVSAGPNIQLLLAISGPAVLTDIRKMRRIEHEPQQTAKFLSTKGGDDDVGRSGRQGWSVVWTAFLAAGHRRRCRTQLAATGLPGPVCR